MATQQDIAGVFSVLRTKTQELVGVDLPDAERDVIRLLAQSGLWLLECLIVDINRIADAQENIARTAMDEFQRNLHR